MESSTKLLVFTPSFFRIEQNSGAIDHGSKIKFGNGNCILILLHWSAKFCPSNLESNLRINLMDSLRKIGGHITEDIHYGDYLVMSEIRYTSKLIVALVEGIFKFAF
jgi:hypothetical protein